MTNDPHNPVFRQFKAAQEQAANLAAEIAELKARATEKDNLVKHLRDGITDAEDTLKEVSECRDRHFTEAKSALEQLAALKSRAQDVSQEEANELQAILRTLAPSGRALVHSARQLVELWEKQTAELEATRKQVVRELDAVIEGITGAVRVHEEGGAENIYASLAVSVSKLLKDRDTALAAKDAAEKREASIIEQLPLIYAKAMADPGRFTPREDNYGESLRNWQARAYDIAKNQFLSQAALTPAPTQEPPAGGASISNDSAGFITRPLRRAGDTSDGSRAGAVTISTEKEGGDEPCASQIVPSVSNSKPSNVLKNGLIGASNSPADVPSEGRGEWMPIETAPKDGSKFLMWVSNAYGSDHIRVGLFRDGKLWWVYDTDEELGHVTEIYATHWQPLPPPPMLPTEGSGA